MAYHDFTLRNAKSKFELSLSEKENLFAQIEAVALGLCLQEILGENIPLARAINTEKARSELIISPILVEVRKIFDRQISLFSGIEFNVDREKQLNGFCDFIVSASPEQLMLTAPVVMIAEAKNENIIGGLGQCIAEMVAANIFNQQENNKIVKVYGVVTTGTGWKFLRLQENTVDIDLDEYSIETPGKILGILIKMIEQKA